MFSQSCNCLPNKKQSIFGNQSTQNMGLLRSLSNKSYHDSADHISFDFEATKKRNNNSSFGSRTNIGLMDLVYSFTDTSRIMFDRRYISTFSVPTERSKFNCKDLITHCNTMTTLPSARSHLVGGFVGSKSQLGRRRKNDVGKINLWDIIRDLVDLVGNAPVHYPHKQNHHSSSFDKKCEIMQDSNKENRKELPNENNSIGLNCFEKPLSSLKQSYADVAKRPMKDYQSGKPRQSEDKSSSTCSESCDIPLSVIEPISSCNQTDFTNRDRITSECSADSEDSFIVFECCEDDNVDKDICSSDDETLSCFDEVSQSDSGIVPSSNSSFCSKQLSKKDLENVPSKDLLFVADNIFLINTATIILMFLLLPIFLKLYFVRCNPDLSATLIFFLRQCFTGAKFCFEAGPSLEHSRNFQDLAEDRLGEPIKFQCLSSGIDKLWVSQVRFAEGKSLATVHPMVTWDYAYRMARRGPWEMMARDSERFKLRIAKTEAVLKPILDPQHRSVVYQDRFSDLVR